MNRATAKITAIFQTHNIDVKTRKDKALLKLFAEQLWWLELSDKSKLLPAVLKKVNRMYKAHSTVLRTDEARFGPLIRDDAELASIADRYDKEMNVFVEKRVHAKNKKKK